MYRGKVALDVAEAQHLMEGLDWQGAVKDIQASVKWLKSNGSPKVEHFHLCSCLFDHLFSVFGVCIKILYNLSNWKIILVHCHYPDANLS